MTNRTRRSVARAGLLVPAALVLSTGFAGPSCGVYDASLLTAAPVVNGLGDASVSVDERDANARDDGGGANDANADACNPSQWPPRPALSETANAANAADATNATGATDASDDEPVAVGAFRTLATTATTPVGYDLDGVCTCPGAASCRAASGAAPHCDATRGIDNAGGDLLTTFATFDVLDVGAASRRLQAGAFGMLLVLRGYNGAPNDAHVTVAMYRSNGVDVGGDAAAPQAPMFDGSDRWTIDPTSLLAGDTATGLDCGADARPCAPLYADDDAYVTGGTLVAHLPIPLSLTGGGGTGAIALQLTGAVVTARLTPRVTAAGGAFAFEDGRIAGRLATSSLLASLAVLTDPFDEKAYLCGSNPTYQGIRSKICASADLSSDVTLDNHGARCDALSLALAFTGEPARLGTVTKAGATPAGCADGGAPFRDQCP